MKYITVANSDTRYNKILPVTIKEFVSGDFENFDIWGDSSATLKERALEQATSYIDSFDYIAPKKDPQQDNKFPLSFQDSVPEDVKRATLDLAVFFLSQHQIQQKAPGQTQRYKDQNAREYWFEVADSKERIDFKDDSTPLPVLKHWLGKYLRNTYLISKRK